MNALSRRTSFVWTGLIVAALGAAGSQLVPHSQGAVPTVSSLVIRLALEAQERVEGASVGYWTRQDQPALVFGTASPGDRGRLRILHWRAGEYEEVWTFLSESGAFDRAIIQDVNGNGRDDLITLWRGGQGGYLDVLIFEWDGRRYAPIWSLEQFTAGGQLTQGASLSVRRIDSMGNVELVLRAPNVKPGESTIGPLQHQVSIYRWDSRRKTLVLFRRYVDRQRTFY